MDLYNVDELTSFRRWYVAGGTSPQIPYCLETSLLGISLGPPPVVGHQIVSEDRLALGGLKEKKYQ